MPRIVPSQVVNLIDTLFPVAATQQSRGTKMFQITRSDATQCAAIVKMVDQIPPELITLDEKNYSYFISGLEAIRVALDMWKGVSSWPVAGVPRLSVLNPVTLLRMTLALCPDEAIHVSTAELNFISDQELRENLRKDISATNQALNNGEWKAATVLAGATIEALLFWTLKNFSKQNIKTAIDAWLSEDTEKKRPHAMLEKWALEPLIEVAKVLDQIEDKTAIEARLAKDFRNLIHPGRAERLNQVCDRGTAFSAIAALEHVIRDLSKKYEKKVKK